MAQGRYPVFDLDGTLLDSDTALAQAFLALGVPESELTRGHVLVEECARLGLEVDAYLAAYDAEAAQPFPGVEALLAHCGPYAICSNKHPDIGRHELERLGWKPELVLFADAFGGPKTLAPVSDQLGEKAASLLFVGDSDHDRVCADDAGALFALAGWNPRTRRRPRELRLGAPLEVLGLLSA